MRLLHALATALSAHLQTTRRGGAWPSAQWTRSHSRTNWLKSVFMTAPHHYSAMRTDGCAAPHALLLPSITTEITRIVGVWKVLFYLFRLHVPLLRWYFHTVLRHRLPIRVLPKHCGAHLRAVPLILPVVLGCVVVHFLRTWALQPQQPVCGVVPYLPSPVLRWWCELHLRDFLHCTVLRVHRNWQVWSRLSLDILFGCFNGDMSAVSCRL